MYEQSEEFARLYEALILFQTRALGYTMNGEDTDERIERAQFVVGMIEKAHKKMDRHFGAPMSLSIQLATQCGQGLVNCGGVCVDPKACWGRSGGDGLEAALPDDEA